MSRREASIQHGFCHFLLVTFALLGNLLLPVLHAHHSTGIHHDGGQPGMISAQMHGKPCLVNDLTDTAPELDSQLPSEHLLVACECLTCKALQPGLLLAAFTIKRPVIAEYAWLHGHHQPAARTLAVVLPPPRAPPFI